MTRALAIAVDGLLLAAVLGIAAASTFLRRLVT